MAKANNSKIFNSKAFKFPFVAGGLQRILVQRRALAGFRQRRAVFGAS